MQAPVGAGTPGQVPYYADTGGVLTATSSITILSNGNVGVGTTTPGTLLSLGNTGASTINISATATSTFGTGINLRTGCFSINGTCVGGGSASLTGTTGQLAYFSGTNTAVGTSSLFISTAGNVGIGTTNPFSKLHIEQTDNLGNGGTNGTYYSLQTLTDPTLSAGTPAINQFNTNILWGTTPGSTRNVLGTQFNETIQAGSLGSNTTLQSINVVAKNLSDNGATTILGMNVSAINSSASGSVTTISGIAPLATNASTGAVATLRPISATFQNTNAAGVVTNAYGLQLNNLSNSGTITNTYGAYIGDITTGTQTNTPYSFYASDSNAYNYFAGNLGIGTTTPGNKLTVQNDSSLTIAQLASASATGSFLDWNNYTSLQGFRAGVIGSGVAGRVGNFEIIDTTAGQVRFVVAPTTGNVGIGSTTPWRTLSVVGTVALNGLTSSATGNALCITTTKDITDAGGASCVPSSIRFKENVETLTDGFALDELNKLRIVSFDYKPGFYSTEDAAGSYGLIAEEVADIDTKLVDYGYDGQPLTLKFEKLTGLAIQAIQELSKKFAGFAEAVTTKVLTAVTGDFKNVNADNLCVKRADGSSVCVTGEQLDALLTQGGQSSTPPVVITDVPPASDEEVPNDQEPTPDEEIVIEETPPTPTSEVGAPTESVGSETPTP